MIAGAAIAVVLLAGCGQSTGTKVLTDATPEALRHAAQTTLAGGTSKLEFTMSMTVQGHDVTMKGTGQMDPAAKRMSMSFDAKDLFSQLAGDSSVPPEASAMFDQPIDMVLDQTVMYMHFPLLASVAGGGKEWLKIDLAAANESLGDLVAGGGGGGAFGSDPSAFLQFLEGTGKVTKIGDEDVRGVRTTHFSGTYTMKEALAALPEDQRAKAERAFGQLGLSTDAQTEEIPFDAWIDAGGLVRRLDTSFDFTKLATGGGNPGLGAMSMSMQFFDFGAPVDIQVPSDDEVQDMSALLGGSKFSATASSIN